MRLKAERIIVLSGAPSSNQHQSTPDSAPLFAPLVSDLKMQAILAKRWQECVNCLSADAPLAATVMMGGLLEGLLLARINQLTDKGPAFKAAQKIVQEILSS